MHHKTFWHNGYEYRCDIMDAILCRLNNLVANHARTFVVCLGVSFPKSYRSSGTSWEVSKLIKRLMETYRSNSREAKKNTDVHYVVCREQKTSSSPHYHIALCFDGSKTRNGWDAKDRAEAIWLRIVGEGATGCIHLSDSRSIRRDGIMIQKPRQDSEGRILEAEQAAYHQAYGAAVLWLMYLAKTDTKGDAPPWANDFFCSRLS